MNAKPVPAAGLLVSAALLVSACGGGHGTPTAAPGAATNVRQATAPASNRCASTSGVTECVSQPSYFKVQGGGGYLYFVRLSYSVDNQAGGTITEVGDGMSIVDKTHQTIADVSVAGTPPPTAVSGQCFDARLSDISVLDGRRYTLRKPLCFELAGPRDRVVAVQDVNAGTTIDLGTG